MAVLARRADGNAHGLVAHAHHLLCASTAACCPGSGGWIRTTDLRVMSPTSCHCSTPRQVEGRVDLRSQRATRQYHRCCAVSRPGSGWVGVGPARSSHAPGSGVKCIVLKCDLARITSRTSAGKPSPVRLARLYRSPGLQLRPLHPVISRGAYQPKAVSALILGGHSHLDAVSGSDLRP